MWPQGLRKGDEHCAYTPYGVCGTLYLLTSFVNAQCINQMCNVFVKHVMESKRKKIFNTCISKIAMNINSLLSGVYRDKTTIEQIICMQFICSTFLRAILHSREIKLDICRKGVHAHTHTHTFNSPLSRTTQVSRYQTGKTNLDFTEARDSEWQWHQLGHMQICTSLQTDNHASTSILFFTGRIPFLPPNQQRQSTEGNKQKCNNAEKVHGLKMV